MQRSFSLYGAEVFLDRLTREKMALNDGLFDYEFSNNMFMEYLDEFYMPYACTFTLPVDCPTINNSSTIWDTSLCKWNTKNTLKPINEQQQILSGLIYKWLSHFQNKLRLVASKHFKIQSYLITYEKTKSGVIHGHGLIYVDNRYYSVVSQIMTQSWLLFSNGDYKAMEKVSLTNGRFKDKAFDKCNNVKSWLNYILKDKELTKHNLYVDKCKSETKFMQNISSLESIKEQIICVEYI